MAPQSNTLKLVPFTATETTVDGKRAIKLVAQDFRQQPKVINLIVHQSLPGFELFPAAYEYVDTPISSLFDIRSPRQATIRIVAAPGVSVHLENWPSSTSDTQLEIYRIQDAYGVPPQATKILSDYFMPPPEINPPAFTLPPGVGANPSQYPVDYFVLESVSAGLLITHPYSTYSLTVEYSKTSESSSDGEDAKTRFCYQVIPVMEKNLLIELTGFGSPPAFTIAKTPNINATLRGGPPQKTAFPRLYKALQYIIPFRIYEARDIISVPPQGTDISDIASRPGFQDATSQIKLLPMMFDQQTLVAYAMFRFGLSFVPLVPQILDVAEFALASGTGKDFLGRTVTKEEKALLGLNVVLDFLPMSVSAVLKVFEQRVTAVRMLSKAVESANVTAEERVLLKEAEEVIRKGGKATTEQLETFSAVLKRMPEEFPPIESILNADSSGFLYNELQEGYQEYRAKEIKAERSPASPMDWAKSNTTGRYSTVLVRMLGPDFRRAASVGKAAASINQRMFTLVQVMKPLGYADQAIKEDLAFILAQRKTLAKNLGFVLKELQSADEVIAFTARTQMSAGRFNNVKGVIGEIFALPMMQDILRKSHPKAFLFTGVTIRRAGAKRAVKFADNIIGHLNGNNLGISVVFEVKSGERGGAEATQQIFDWIEERLEEGDQLIIPSGSKYFDALGNEMTLVKGIKANYQIRPSAEEHKAGIGLVTGLANARRTIIAAEGTSQLGLKAADQTYAKIERLNLPLTSAQIDYLGAQLVQSLAKSKLPL